MQTEASTRLPIVYLNVHKTFNRMSNPDSKNSIPESRKMLPCRNTLLSSNRNSLNPLPGQPYRSGMKQQSLSDESKSGNKSILKQRVMSAKMLRFKQLQNQLADAHYHLNELANENRLLKALQKRQDSALRRYEGTNAELPRIINSHHEELRVLQAKYKKLKELHRDTCNSLKEKETELYSVNSQNKHLLQLSKDRNLGEREKLQLQISDMNYKIQQQQETIQLLQRKLALETKSLKHQLHIEISKHKDTQKNLQETIEKLKNVECLLDVEKKRLYYNGQLSVQRKNNLVSHSLTNLTDMSDSNPVKIFSKNKKYENGITKDSLPLLDTLESNEDEEVTQITDNIKHDHQINQLKSETMANLQQVRKFRLQRSPHMHKNAYSMDDLSLKNSGMKSHYNKELTLYRNALMDFGEMSENDSLNNDNSNKLKKMVVKMRKQNSQKLQTEFDVESDSSNNVESENKSEHHVKCCSIDNTKKSRELYARLISSTDDTSDILGNILDNTLDNLKKENIHYSDNDDDDQEEEETEEEEEEKRIDNLAEDLTFQRHKYKSKSRILQHLRNKNSDDGDSEVDCIERIAINEDHYPIEHETFQANLFTYSKSPFSKPANNIVHQEYNAAEIKKHCINGESQNATLERISNHAIDNIHMKNIGNPEQSSNIKKTSFEKQYPLKNDKMDKSFADMERENCIKEEQVKCLKVESIYSDIPCSKLHHNTSKQNNTTESKNLSSPEKKENKSSQQTNAEYEMLSNIGFIKSENTEHIKESEAMLSKTFLPKYFNENNLSEEKSRVEETSNKIYCNNEETLNESVSKHCLERKHKLNTSLEEENVNISLNNTLTSHKTEKDNDAKDEITDTKEINNKKRVINYNKEKLLATMKAIDDNENIEFLHQECGNRNIANRMQITENLFRGLPTHSKPKRDVIKNIFEDNHIGNKAKEEKIEERKRIKESKKEKTDLKQ